MGGSHGRFKIPVLAVDPLESAFIPRVVKADRVEERFLLDFV